MWFSITKFELEYQLKSPTFWVSSILFFLMAFGMMASDFVHISGNVYKNAPLLLVTLLSGLQIFFMFVTTAFGANAVLRDQETGFGPLIYTTHIHKADYVLGRMLGAFLICALCFLTVPFGILLGTVMPWLDKETLGATDIRAYVYGYALIALPSIFFMVAFFSSIATLTKSMMGSYLAAVGLFIAYMAASFAAGSNDSLRLLYAWIEPFGGGALAEVTRYWTADDNNHRLPAFTGLILGNRLIFMAIGIALIATTYRVMRLDTVGAKARKKSETKAAPPAIVSELPNPAFGFSHTLSTLLMRTRFETGQVMTSPAYPILMLMALVFTGLVIMVSGQIYGTDVYPVTRVLVSSASAGFFFFANIVAVFYSGELVWRERDRKTHEIIDSTAMPNWAYVVPKALALILVLFSTLAFSVVADMGAQIIKGYYNFEFGKYVVWMLLPRTLDFALVGIIAIFIQSLAPHKFIGWGIMLVWFVTKIALSKLGFDLLLYNYGASPPILLSDMNGQGQFWIGWLWFKLYWIALAVAMLVISHLLWRRGVATGLLTRLKRLPDRMTGPAPVILAASLIAFAGLGGFLAYNTLFLNKYLTKGQLERQEVDYEKTFMPVVNLPQPSVAAVKVAIDLYPHQLKYTTKGSYLLKNETSGPISDIYAESPWYLHYSAFAIDGATLKQSWPKHHVELYHLSTPMQPGETRTLHFAGQFQQKGFGNNGILPNVVDNGTFINNRAFAPSIGIRDAQAMTDKATRRKYKLPPLARMKTLEDPTANGHNYVGADWTTSDITVSTVADQTPIAPGYRVSDVTANGRRTSRFVSTTPILNFFSVQSARYKEKRVRHNGVDLTVYYDAQHAYNVDRMLKAQAAALDYYQANFGPFQFKQARILEFPAYSTFAQSFAGTIPYSEGIGFIADVRNPDKVDYVTYVTAHEMAHQWWAHQIVGADKQGATVLSETLSQYSALMVMEKMYGPDQIRRFLKFELDAYLRSRGAEQIEEQPLYRVENQQYIHYNKGSLVMYLLKDRMGEAAVNRALSKLLVAYKFKGAPYPSSTDLVAALRAEARPEDQALITDLMEKITVMDLRATNATVTKRKDGQFDVAFTVTAIKNYANGKGKETEAPMAEPIDIGLFTAQPGDGKFTSANVVLMTKQVIKSGSQRVTFVTKVAPTYVGVDPYNKWIDRDSADNVVKVGVKTAP